jgi:hypothetical protein
VGVVVTENFSHFFMSEFIVGLVSLLEVETALKFSLMQFLFYFFASRQSFLQFL